MKETIISTVVLTLLVGCSKTLPQDKPVDVFSYTFVCEAGEYGDDTALKSELGTNSIRWKSGDKIGTYAGGLNNNAGSVTVANPCTFQVQTSSPLVKGNKVYAYAPYSSAAGSSPSSVKLSVPPVQKMTNGKYISNAMPMAAVPYVVPQGGIVSPTSVLRFQNLASLVELRIYTEGIVGTGEVIKSVSFTSSAADVCGDYTANITSNDPVLTKVSGYRKVTTILDGTALTLAGSGYRSCFLTVAPGSYSGTYEVFTDKAVYTISTSTLTYSKNGWKVLGFKLRKATRYANTGLFSIRQLKVSNNPAIASEERIGNSYILQTNAGSIIVIDGGYKEDSQNLHDKLVGFYGANRVDHWFVTHPHADHAGCILAMLGGYSGAYKHLCPEIGRIHYSKCDDSVKAKEAALIDAMNNYMNAFKSISVNYSVPGATLNIDGVNIKILATAALRDPDNTLNDPHYSAVNNTSMVIRVWDSQKSLLILGDSQYAEGDELLLSYPEYLSSDYVQMSHHGNWGVRPGFYESIDFSVALWPTPNWLWNASSTSGYNTYQYKNTLSSKGVVSHVATDGEWYLPMTDNFGTENFNKEGSQTL